MYTALQATSQTLMKFLDARMRADVTLNTYFSASNLEVSLHTPYEMTDKNKEGVSIWLYRVVRDETRLNDAPIVVPPADLRQPPLPVCLHYLITPITDKHLGASPETEQIILGKVLQAFHSHPRFRGTDLDGDFAGTTVDLNVRLETLTLEEISRVWEALRGSYQLSVSYEVSVVNIDSERELERVSPVLVSLPEYGLVAS